MSIDNMTIAEFRELQNMLAPKESELPFKPGEKWLFRSVTHYLVGEVVKVWGGQIIELRNASWVADTGRFSEAMKSGKLEEVEHQEHRCMFNAGSMVDSFEWTFKLPEETK